MSDLTLKTLTHHHKSDKDIFFQIDTFISQLKRRQITGSNDVGMATAHLLVRFVSAARWTHIDSLISDLRLLGKRLIAAQPREFACGNMVRRVLALIREEIHGNNENGIDNKGLSSSSPLITSMFNLLSTEDKSIETANNEKKTGRDLKPYIIEGIQELIEEIRNIEDSIAGMSVEMIHENEVLLTPSPNSKTVLEFLRRASQKRKFSVLVTESFPNETEIAHAFAKKLAKAGIETVIIPDSSVYAVMSRVGKVIVGARTVLANGGCISASGIALACEAAKNHKTPVLAVTGVYKLSPLYPFDVESLIEVGNTGKVVDFSDKDMVENVEVMNPTYDYVAPENIDIYVTNIGGYSPSFIYRLVLDHYSSEDNKL
ncbi:IF-2B-domain-containing protein [Nadsonia fulvescens var. elongata DSM 6958]|uniref:Translation initiation factor eIF2B subunit beta n=1 Tax=Nadsonia fulvescens var. elongata DSM 6958 TaxID=857566 RepID=A0A1E3PJ74_9ASCO|nr:IF-2B-domain-containing protein [Nadsonia fulvescens var. elongata DSM 6958]